MRTLILMICATMVWAPAHALNQYNINNMTCAEVQSVLKRDGQAQLRYTAPDNPSLQLYGRYVGANICHTRIVSVPTRDTNKCQVRECYRFGGR